MFWIETYDKYLQRRFRIKVKNLYKIKETVLQNKDFSERIYNCFQNHWSFLKLIQSYYKDEDNFLNILAMDGGKIGIKMHLLSPQ